MVDYFGDLITIMKIMVSKIIEYQYFALFLYLSFFGLGLVAFKKLVRG